MISPHFGQGSRIFIQTGLAGDAEFAYTDVTPEVQLEGQESTILDPIEPLPLAPPTDATRGELYPSPDYPLEPSSTFYSDLSDSMGDMYNFMSEGNDSQADLTFDPFPDPMDLMG